MPSKAASISPSTSTSIPPSGLPKRKNIILDRMRTEAQSEALRMRPNCQARTTVHIGIDGAPTQRGSEQYAKIFLNFWGNKTCSETLILRDNPFPKPLIAIDLGSCHPSISSCFPASQHMYGLPQYDSTLDMVSSPRGNLFPGVTAT